MPIRLNNKFSPNTHKRKDTLAKLKQLSYNKNFKDEIIGKDSVTMPVFCMGNYTILLGFTENGEFQEWLDKKNVTTPTADVLRPESSLVDLVLKAVNMFPDSEALLARLVDRLTDILKNKKS